MEQPSLLVVAVVALVFYFMWKAVFKTKTLPLPPGPKGLPIVGNIFDLPPAGVKEQDHWLKHRYLYGPVSSVTILGTTLIIINDRQAAFDLLEKDSQKTSSRPRPVFAFEFAGFRDTITLTDDWKVYRLYRKAISKVIGSRASVSKFSHMQELEATRFLWRVLQNPKDFADHLRTEAGAFILKVTYGYTVVPNGIDPLVTLVQQAVDLFARCAMPGTWLVNEIPALRYIPEWFPGGGFKAKGREISRTLMEIVEKPLAFTRYRKAQNSHVHSYASDLIDQNEDDKILKWTASAMYMAGADTTVSSLKGFLLAMLHFPEVQRTAQAEIDRVVGTDRLPTLADRDNLPYIEALLQEVHRWHTVTPMGLAHMADEDFIYDGFLIPKGAYLMPNAWYYNNDPEVYPNPRVFSPERYLSSDSHVPEPDPRYVSFGFGRRICPGRFIADTAIFITMAQILAAYNVTKAVGEDGQEILPSLELPPGIVQHPAPFQCKFTPRSPKYEEIIRAVETEHPFDSPDAELLSQIKF